MRSINASGHKFGLAPLGVGWAIWREASDLPEGLVFHVNYLGGDMPTFALEIFAAGRPSGVPVLLDAASRDGRISADPSACYYVAQHIGRGAGHDRARSKVLFDGDSRYGIPAVSWTLRDDAGGGYSLFDLSERLRARGWQVAAYSMVPNITDMTVMRVLIRHGATLDFGNALIDDIRRSIEYFRTHPVSKPMTEEEGGSHNHDAHQKHRLHHPKVVTS